MVIVRRIIAELIIIFIQQITDRGTFDKCNLQEYYHNRENQTKDNEGKR